MTIKIKKTNPKAVLPTRATAQSAGLDLYACLSTCVTVNPGEHLKVATGVAVQLEPETVGLVFGRSGLGVNHGITLSNSVGVIDSDYRGEIIISLFNSGKTAYTINPKDRIAQLVVMPIILPQPIETEHLEDTQRADSGFGSSGR